MHTPRFQTALLLLLSHSMCAQSQQPPPSLSAIEAGCDDSVTRVLLVGDSITLGVGFEVEGRNGWTQVGFRQELRELLTAEAAQGKVGHIDLVGPSVTAPGGRFAGFNGATLDGIRSSITESWQLSSAGDPDIIAVMAGTNTFFFESATPAQALQQMEDLVLTAVESAGQSGRRRPRPVHIAISACPPIEVALCAKYHEAPWNPPDCPANMQQNIGQFNAGLPTLVAAINHRLNYTAASFHSLEASVNEGTGFMQSDFSTWGIHFSQSGYQKIAKVWGAHLSALVSKAPSQSTPSQTQDAVFDINAMNFIGSLTAETAAAAAACGNSLALCSAHNNCVWDGLTGRCCGEVGDIDPCCGGYSAPWAIPPTPAQPASSSPSSPPLSLPPTSLPNGEDGVDTKTTSGVKLSSLPSTVLLLTLLCFTVVLLNWRG